MNTKKVCMAAVLAAVFVLLSNCAQAQNSIVASAPAGAKLDITAVPGKTGGHVTINDFGDHEWVLQTSTDLNYWAELGTWKVHNGSFNVPYLHETGVPGVFFRAYYDPTRQDLTSTLQSALLLPPTPFNYAHPALPPNFLVPPISTSDNTPSNNPVTDVGATLGRVLFYDKRLSTNQTVACSSCHQAAHGFSDPKRFSVGYDGSVGTRHAMRLANDRWYVRGHFFWDERAATLEDQVLQPIQNPIEMGMTLPTLVSRLSAEPFYSNLFTAAFGTPDVTTNRISFALAQYVRSIISTNSKYDRGIPVGFANFTPQENQGRQLFFGPAGCAACHGTDNFSPPNIFNNGLEFPYVDKGVGGITGRAQDMGVFKVPSLRNVGLTAPYMHDGRFATLDQVVEFYNSGVVDNPNLAPQLRVPPPPGPPPPQPPPPRRLNLTADQKAALVAFLNTLIDTSLTTDPKFSDPFNYGN